MSFDLFERGVQQVIHSGPVFGGDGKNGDSERVERRCVRLLQARVDFICRHHKRVSSGAQQPSEFLIERSEPRGAVDDQHEHGSIFNRHARLAKNLGGNQSLVVRNDAARVHNLDDTAMPFRFAVDTVAGNARLVGDDGAARARQAVE